MDISHFLFGTIKQTKHSLEYSHLKSISQDIHVIDNELVSPEFHSRVHYAVTLQSQKMLKLLAMLEVFSDSVARILHLFPPPRMRVIFC